MWRPKGRISRESCAAGFHADSAYIELVPKPSVQPTLSRAFVEHFVEPCGFRLFSTKWSDKEHDKDPRAPCVGQALVSERGGSDRSVSDLLTSPQVGRYRGEDSLSMNVAGERGIYSAILWSREPKRNKFRAPDHDRNERFWN